MKWSKEVLENINFENITNREEKEKIAIQIAQKVKNGETIGFGSGSTSYLAVKEISKRIKKENIFWQFRHHTRLKCYVQN